MTSGEGRRVDSKQGTRPLKGEIVQSVVRAARVAQALAVAPGGMQLREITARVGLHKTTVLRLLNTLISLGVACKDARTGRYRWQPVRWLWLAGPLRDAVSATQLVDVVLEELVAETGETAAFVLPSLDCRSVVVASAALPDDPLLADPRERTELPMHAVAGGKIFLAALPQDEVNAWMERGLPAVTEHTVTSPDALMAELAQVASQGYAVSKQECVAGVNTLAVPVFDRTGGVEAALVLVGPASRMGERKMLGFVSQLQAASQRLSELLASLNLSGRGGAGGSSGEPPPEIADGSQDGAPPQPPFRVL